jgi:uncharacterized iron-regulated membrane protein
MFDIEILNFAYLHSGGLNALAKRYIFYLKHTRLPSHNIHREYTTMDFRKLHRKTAPILFLPLLLTALTGVAYRVGRAWFGIPENVAEGLMTIHEGRFLGRPLVPIYVLLMGLGLIGLIATGLAMVRKRATNAKVKRNQRWVHRLVGAIACLPLFISSVTGIAYRLGNAWFGLSSSQSSFLMSLHEGRYLGNTLKPLYVLVVGAGLVVLLITGLQLTGLFRKRNTLQPRGD